MPTNLNSEDEHSLGVLCRNGLIKEEYSEESQDLVRRFTKKGIKEANRLFQDKEYLNEFIKMFKIETIGMSKSEKIGVLNEVKNILNGTNKV